MGLVLKDEHFVQEPKNIIAQALLGNLNDACEDIGLTFSIMKENASCRKFINKMGWVTLADKCSDSINILGYKGNELYVALVLSADTTKTFIEKYRVGISSAGRLSAYLEAFGWLDLTNLAVNPKHRRKGIASRIIRKIGDAMIPMSMIDEPLLRNLTKGLYRVEGYSNNNSMLATSDVLFEAFTHANTLADNEFKHTNYYMSVFKSLVDSSGKPPIIISPYIKDELILVPLPGGWCDRVHHACFVYSKKSDAYLYMPTDLEVKTPTLTLPTVLDNIGVRSGIVRVSNIRHGFNMPEDKYIQELPLHNPVSRGKTAEEYAELNIFLTDNDPFDILNKRVSQLMKIIGIEAT